MDTIVGQIVDCWITIPLPDRTRICRTISFDFPVKQWTQQQNKLKAEEGALEEAAVYGDTNSDQVDYSDRFNHFKIEDDGGFLYRRGGEESMTLKDEQMSNQIFLAFGALMVALLVVIFAKCIKHGKELLLPHPAYEQLL